MDEGEVQNYNGLEAYFSPLFDSFDFSVKAYVEEPLFCARDIFFSGGWRANYSNVNYEASDTMTPAPWVDEPFVFGIDGADPGLDIANFRFPLAIDPDSPGRDVHGQLFGVNDPNYAPGFEFVTYGDLLAEYRACASSVVTKFDGSLDEELDKVATTEDAEAKFDELLESLVDELGDDCVGPMFEKVETGLALVFGDEPSPGFICGMKDAILGQDAVVTDGQNEKLPGYAKIMN